MASQEILNGNIANNASLDEMQSHLGLHCFAGQFLSIQNLLTLIVQLSKVSQASLNKNIVNSAILHEMPYCK